MGVFEEVEGSYRYWIFRNALWFASWNDVIVKIGFILKTKRHFHENILDTVEFYFSIKMIAVKVAFK